MSAKKRKCGVNAAKIKLGVYRQTESPCNHTAISFCKKKLLLRTPQGARQSVFPSPVIAKPCKRLWQSVILLKGRRILSRLPLLRCPKVVIRLEREQLLTAALPFARFILHCRRSQRHSQCQFVYFERMPYKRKS